MVRRELKNLSEYDYDLPEDRVRLVPPPRRGDSRLLVVPRVYSARTEPMVRTVADLPSLLMPGDHLVVNDSRVIPARAKGVTKSQRSVDILFLGPFGDSLSGTVRFLGRGIRPGALLRFFSGRSEVWVSGYSEEDGCFVGEYRGARPLSSELETEGEMPLPPYIAKKRKADPSDRDRYQTVYSRVPGSVAAPTAGLHLGEDLLRKLGEKGIELSTVTLHVGIGTFRPLADGDLDQHRMHSEWYYVSEETARGIAGTKRNGGRVIAVGTTSLRALQSSMILGQEEKEKRVMSGSGWTDLFIRPGHSFGPVDGLLTNFHTPRSTLLVLVDAFLGENRWRTIYEKALEEGFMFLSYGDAMLVL